MKTFLIVEDDKIEANLIERRLKQCFSCEVVTVVGPTSAHLKELVESALRNQIFDGTLLDIIYSGERTGGIQLWSSLSADLKNNAGRLVVVTKDAPMIELEEFVERFAEGRKVDNYVEGKMTSLFLQFFGEPPLEQQFVDRSDFESLRRMVGELSERLDRLERTPRL